MRARARMSVWFAIVLLVVAVRPALGQTNPPPRPPQPPPTSTSPDSGFPTIDVAAGYTYLYESGVDTAPANKYNAGWVAAYSQRLSSTRLFAVGEINGHYRKQDDETWQLYAYLGGIRFGLFKGGRVSGFGQVLIGGERFSVPGFHEKGFVFQPGGGVDTLFGSVRLRFQGDYRMSDEDEATFHSFRFAASFVIPIKK